MCEHAVFIEASLPAPRRQLAAQAAQFVRQYQRLLAETIRAAGGAVSEETLKSGQFYTRYTEAAELSVQKAASIEINRSLTRMEYNIVPYATGSDFSARKGQKISQLNQRILNLTNSFVRFKSDLLTRQSSCELFTFLYTADLEHILHEAMRYADLLNGLQSKADRTFQHYADFWNRNMSDHAKTMRGLFDPKAEESFAAADSFVKLYAELLRGSSGRRETATQNDLTDARSIAQFKADTTKAILECKVRSLMNSLYTDHLLREANHYIYLMRTQ